MPEDLKDTGRLLDLYEQAVELGLVTASEHDRLRFVAAAEHARIIGTKNPCGLFVRLVRGGLLHFVTHDDEVAASVRLRRHLYGGLAGVDAAGTRVGIVPAGGRSFRRTRGWCRRCARRRRGRVTAATPSRC